MNLNQVDVSKLPADVRKQFKQLQVMHAERKIQNKAKSDFLSFVKCVGPSLLKARTIDTLQKNLMTWQKEKFHV